MANKIDTYEVSSAIHSSADKFYGFFKNDITKLVTIFPVCFTGAKVLEGVQGTDGCVTQWNYLLGPIPLTAKVKTDEVDDEAKSISFVVLEGDLMVLYKSFKVSLTVTDGLAKWTFTFEKRTLFTPIPELYGPIVITASTLVDAFLLINNKADNKIDTLEVSTAIHSSAEKFYGFFKYDMDKLVTIFPACFTAAKLLEGEEGTVGCIKQWNYLLGAIPLTAKVLTEAVDDGGKSITFTVLEGDLMLLYKSFKVTLAVTDGSVKWRIAFEKLTFLSPIPELYGPIVITASTLVDAFLLINVNKEEEKEEDNAIESFEVSAAIKSPADEYYGFFKYDMSKLVTIFPAGFTGVKILEGEEGAVGCVKLWNYVVGAIPLSAKVKTEAIDDDGKSISYEVLEGDLMLLYKSFKNKITVADGLVKWSFAFEKRTFLTPIPQLYGPLFIAASTLVDAFLLITK